MKSDVNKFPRKQLPPALDKSRHDLSEEVAFAKSLTPERRLAVLEKVCRAELEILKLNKNADQLLKTRDPLPASTVKALRRLARHARD
ncbi:MAG: hypothetical protein U5O39_12385 [Gammaproteobacteria bacterium]|nr:hypothetical protein [Gammaproteobacteria bacterium]